MNQNVNIKKTQNYSLFFAAVADGMISNNSDYFFFITTLSTTAITECPTECRLSV